uniref:Receptor-like serine/threonine-protein kinase n=1 Tax=Anthurium amnicola TaxID=1678845 RepID=A0A1D1XRK7_9ARAE
MADKYNPGRSSPSPRLPALLLLIHLLCCSLRPAHGGDFPTEAGPSTRWTSTPAMPNITNFRDGSQVRPVLLRPLMYIPPDNNSYAYGYAYEYAYACGFYCTGACESFLFAVVLVPDAESGIFMAAQQLVWAANRDRPVRENATLQLGSDGDLVLTDADGTKVWSSGTSGKPVAGLNLTESGNLVLFGGDKNKSIWWESFAHPTDSLVPGQKLRVGHSLKANDSATNFTEGLYYLSAKSSDVVDAFFKSDPPTNYASYESQTADSKNVAYFEFVNWSVSPLQFLRLESDGHLRRYEWRSGSVDWFVVSDLLTNPSHPKCFYPTVCGRYGICSVDEQCSCPQWYGDDGDEDGSYNYFVPVDRQDPKSGCKPVIPFSCGNPSTTHRLLRFENVSYSLNLSSVKTDEKGCRTLCENNCSCRAAFYDPAGSCFLTSEVFSLQKDEAYYHPKVAFIKVQNPPSPSNSQKTRVVILVSTLGSLFLLLLCLCSCRILVLKKKRILREKDMDAEDEEEDLEQVSGAPRRFSLEELRVATGDFCKKLGQGGFGFVYEGRIDDKAVAVKRLDGASQGRKEFLAEVETLGKIHHVNLVKLVGYCAEKSCRLLVYEFMPNGSLDRWIFSRAQPAVNPLDWQTRCKILLGVAKGISYLHEECSQKIAHLDIKPQNILLDDRFEAKVSDFGLAKLIDRDLTHVVTRMRGTPGYLAPEWVSSGITEKVDVYSFGVVVLETVCGRRNLVRSQPEEDALLVNLLKRKAENGDLLDLVDESIKNAGFHNEEAMKMFKIAMWCLQDKNKRPSMSTVVKALESGLDVETIFLTSSMVEWNVANGVCNSTLLLPSLLSAPR